MTDNYYKYTSKQLLHDDYFISSMINPTPVSEDFWSSLVNDHLIDPAEFELARNFIEIMKKPGRIMTTKERMDLLLRIEIQNKKTLRRKLKTRQFYLYGAIASLFIAVFMWSYFLLDKPSQTIINLQDVMSALPDVDKDLKDIQLILPDNKSIELEDKNVDIVLQQDGEIVVNSKKIEKSVANNTLQEDQPSYNQLIIPFGRHSSLTLPDGTRMHINSGSKVVFPNRFSKTEREIFVNGEVYLEVAHNEKVPFYVKTDKMNIKVLGTTLNVSAYDGDKQAVVLVTGAVKVVTENKHETYLSPNQMLNYSDGECNLSLVDTYEYTSWKDGYFIYKKELLANIMKQMSRYYGVRIVCDPQVESITCSGKLDLKEDLDKVMKDLSDILRIEFLFQNNSYTVKKNI